MDAQHHELNIDIANALGPESQLRQLMEECCELSVSANKMIRLQKKASTICDRMKARNHLVEEMGDVLVVIDQIKSLLKITESELSDTMEGKVDRTWKRITEEKEG